MKRIGLLAIVFLMQACAHVRGEPPAERLGMELWRAAHEALAEGRFGRADTLFTQLAREHGATEIGRESFFYIGALRLDPRNDAFSAERALAPLREYLAHDTTGPAQINRRPEGQTLHEMAEQLTLPPSQRIPALRGTIVVSQPAATPEPAPAPVAPADAAAEIARLQELIRNRDAQIRRQEEELERIRRILSPPSRPQE
jgi:hypothetical protein